MMKKFWILPITALLIALTVFAVSIFLLTRPLPSDIPPVPTPRFNGEAALEYIRQQVAVGPRYVDSDEHEKAQDALRGILQQFSDAVVVQQSYHPWNGKFVSVTNLIGRIHPENPKRVLLVTHYDTQQFASNDHEHPGEPVQGANNGASGTAVLLELAKEYSRHSGEAMPPPLASLAQWGGSPVGVDIAFFDGEEWDLDHPNPQNQWHPLGSSYFVEHLKDIYPKELPIVAIDLDLVCSKTMKLYEEQSSLERARSFVEKFWAMAHSNWPEQFFSDVKWDILDDHTVLNTAGIPSFLLIDYDYPYLHTTHDTIEKCSAQSLQAVGDSVSRFVESLK